MKQDSHKKQLPENAEVLAKAVVRAAEYWDLTNAQLGKIIGLSESTISRIRKGTVHIEPDSKSGELALMFLRVYRGLDAYLGGNTENEKAWLKAENSALRGVPLDVMKKVEGLTCTVQYVDYMRGHL
jgi:DNA-binding XRE family transcriptional regulator